MVEFCEDVVDEPGHLGKESSIVAEERAQRFGHCEYELAMWEFEKEFVGQMLGKEKGALAATGRTEVEAFAGKRSEVVMSAFGVGTADARDALEIIATRREPLADSLDTFDAVHAVSRRVFLIVLLAELREVAFEDSMELIAATGNIPFGRNRL